MPHPLPPDDENDEDPDASLALDPREAARDRRRDHDAEAARRELMSPGIGKVFKQITDSIGRKGSRDQNHARKTTRRDS